MTTTRRRFLRRAIWLGAALAALPLTRWLRPRTGAPRELALGEADLYGPHDLAG